MEKNKITTTDILMLIVFFNGLVFLYTSYLLLRPTKKHTIPKVEYSIIDQNTIPQKQPKGLQNIKKEEI